MRSLLTLAGVVLMGAVALTQNITYDFDKAANFSSFDTYTWVRGTVLADQLNHKRVVDAINAQLVAKGLSRVESAAHADLLVAYHATFDRDLQVTGFSSGWGGYAFRGSRSGVARTEQILTGTLVVDMVDARTSTIVWRGIATKEIDVNDKPEKRDRNITRAAERLFKNYPPDQTRSGR